MELTAVQLIKKFFETPDSYNTAGRKVDMAEFRALTSAERADLAQQVAAVTGDTIKAA